jgi:hypothetical protein
VGDEFVEFYQQIPNPEQIYGFPITEPFQNVDGVLVQYFQRARFEFQPEAPEELRIRLTPLGNLLYEPVEPFPLAANPNACQTFPETANLDIRYPMSRSETTASFNISSALALNGILKAHLLIRMSN